MHLAGLGISSDMDPEVAASPAKCILSQGQANMIKWTIPNGETQRATINNITYGLFYDSVTKMRHISPYKPYISPPKRGGLCGKAINLTGTGMEDNICQDCINALIKIEKEDNGR